MLESSAWWSGKRRAGRLTNSATIWAQNQAYELVHHNTHPIYDLLELIKAVALLFQSCSSLMTQGNNSLSRRTASEDPASIRVEQTRSLKPHQCLFAMIEHLQVKQYGQYGLTESQNSLKDKIFLFFILFLFLLSLIYFIWKNCVSRGQVQMDKEINRIRMQDVQATENK